MTAAALSLLRAVPVRTSCALCPGAPASPLGLCTGCLRAAADELTRLTPHPAQPGDGRPSSVAFRDLCGRCGSHRHGTEFCDA
jgi:hypothetical protein